MGGFNKLSWLYNKGNWLMKLSQIFCRHFWHNVEIVKTGRKFEREVLWYYYTFEILAVRQECLSCGKERWVLDEEFIP